MARITEKEVHQAAAELDAQGVKPTTSKIREKLGSGSFSTIQTFLLSYEGTGSNTETPDTPEELAAILPAIWAKAWEIAQDKFEAERTRFDAQCKAYDDEITTLRKIIEDQDNDLEQLTVKSETQSKKFEAIAQKCESLIEEKSFLKGQLEALKNVDKFVKAGEKVIKEKKPAVKQANNKKEPANHIEKKPAEQIDIKESLKH
jgi:preprotein translocase subunit SecA